MMDTRKQIALLTPNFPPETNAGAQRIGAFAIALRDAGWQVAVLTLAPHHPQNHVYDGYNAPGPMRTVEEGLTVIRLRPFLVPKDRLALRLLSETLFATKAVAQLLKLKPDAVLASSPYMFLGPAGQLAAALMRIPFVWDVRDLTWQYPGAAGKRTYRLDHLLASWMRLTASRATALVTTTNGQLDYFSRRPILSTVVPNGVSDAWLEQLLAIGPRDSDTPATVVYAGLIGYMHGLDTLVRTAQLMPDVRFLIVGDGPEAPRLKELSTSLGLSNVQFWGYVPHDRLLEAYQQASVLVSHVRASPVFRLIQSAKVWEYLATGRPVVHASEGESVTFLEQGGLAATAAPERPEALATTIRSLLTDPEGAVAMGARARAFTSFERRRSVLNQRLVRILDETIRR